MNSLEARYDLVEFFRSLGINKYEVFFEYLTLNKDYKSETIKVIKEALFDYIDD